MLLYRIRSPSVVGIAPALIQSALSGTQLMIGVDMP